MLGMIKEAGKAIGRALRGPFCPSCARYSDYVNSCSRCGAAL